MKNEHEGKLNWVQSSVQSYFSNLSLSFSRLSHFWRRTPNVLESLLTKHVQTHRHHYITDSAVFFLLFLYSTPGIRGLSSPRNRKTKCLPSSFLIFSHLVSWETKKGRRYVGDHVELFWYSRLKTKVCQSFICLSRSKCHYHVWFSFEIHCHVSFTSYRNPNK